MYLIKYKENVLLILLQEKVDLEQQIYYPVNAKKMSHAEVPQCSGKWFENP